MKRDVGLVGKGTFDLLIIGGGVMGLAAAREAASRGLRTALVEKGDFGGATSANSLKLIHGGLRYLQHGDIGRLRQSVRERLAFMRTAPHLVHPLPFLVPTYGHAAKGREAMTVAFLLYSLLAWDRNATGDPEKAIPTGHTVSAEECLRLFPGFQRDGLTGGAIFHDGQASNLDRLTLSIGLAAADSGAVLVNYVRAASFLGGDGRVEGVRAVDGLSGRELDVGARVVLNAAGPWADEMLSRLPRKTKGSGFILAKAVNIVVRRLLSPTHAVGLECPEKSDSLVGRGGRLFFITPWRGVSLVGTTYHTWSSSPDELSIGEEDVRELIDGINGAWPDARLRPEEVSFFHRGLVPITAPTGPSGANLAKADRIIDHSSEGVEGLLSMVGVKYTTAREVAEHAVDLVFRKLGRRAPPSATARTPLPGGKIDRHDAFMAEAVSRRPEGMSEAAMRHLASTYGSDYQRILAYARLDPRWGAAVSGCPEVLRAEILHAAREEMAVTLADAVLRRTEMGACGHPGRECLLECADIMAGELGWDETRRMEEVRAAESSFAAWS